MARTMQVRVATGAPAEASARVGGLLSVLLLAAALPARAQSSGEAPVRVPKLWDAAALADWATPLAGLGEPPTLISEAEYYAMPVDDLLTDPVYLPEREPPGYREALIARGPKRLIEPEKLKTRADWIEAGRVVFEALDTPSSRSDDPAVLAHFTDAKAVAAFRDASHDVATADGILLDYRWVVDRDRKLKLSLSSCYGCHTRLMPDGSVIVGAPSNYDLGDAPATAVLLDGIAPRLSGLTEGEKLYVAFGVPWLEHDEHAAFRRLADAEVRARLGGDTGEPPGTMFARFNGSPLHKTRMADLRGIRDRRYLDATATHVNRGPEDLARYGILVEYAPDTKFGPHEMLPASARKEFVRPPDAAMYALGLYLYSLDPLPSPHPLDATALAGKAVFEEQKCGECHTPPVYSSNELVAVPGFEPPRDDPRTARLRISPRGVGTDSALALGTRKGTGYYRIPSLRGLWYRGLYGHQGSVNSLEDWFDPRRLRDDFVPTGFRGPRVEHAAVRGHEFGLDLDSEEKRALIAFLRTL
jgi:mono/diheme cytochrome c family protein